MNTLKIFESEVFGQVRVVECNGEPWFVASDVCDALELSNTSQTLTYLDDDEKGITSNDTLGGEQKMLIISEPGLYSLVLRSRKPEAKAFKRWIIHDVLPDIRKHGLYAKDEIINSILEDPDFGIGLLQKYKYERQQRELAESQRDNAIRTKAEIGSRREATAMATASIATRKVGLLEDELGRGKRYRAVKAIQWLQDVFEPTKGMYSVVGKTLRRMSGDLGYNIEKVPCAEYPDGINAYHVDVIDQLYRELRDNPGMLYRYRRSLAA